jgi:hypothetical protein
MKLRFRLDIEAGVLTVSVLVPGMAGFAEKAQLTPAGSPVQARLTAELNPPTAAMVTV